MNRNEKFIIVKKSDSPKAVGFGARYWQNGKYYTCGGLEVIFPTPPKPKDAKKNLVEIEKE
jgi:hypothetical protein